jgi:toxin ParE1/3/4
MVRRSQARTLRSARFHCRGKPLAAADADDEIERQVDMLRQQPKMGRPGRRKGTRELVISHTPFVVVYRIRGTTRIEGLTLLHSSKQGLFETG